MSCPDCGSAPHVLKYRSRERGHDWFTVYCQQCWRPPCAAVSGQGPTRAIAEKHWRENIERRESA